jgi:membrane protein DedA with SNARE-associated domain
VSAGELNHLIHLYGCAIVFTMAALQAVGVPLPGTTALILASVYAADHRGLPIAWVIVAAAFGALLGTSGGYLIGRWGGERLLARLTARMRQGPERVAYWRAEFAAHGGKLVVLGRFVVGLRNLAGLLAGASGMRPTRFLLLSAFGAGIWALSAGLEYYYFGHALAGSGSWLQIVLVVIGIGWAVISVRYLRRRALGPLPAPQSTQPAAVRTSRTSRDEAPSTR